jgi:tetratricopeptide (TPR) repeat protein
MLLAAMGRLVEARSKYEAALAMAQRLSPDGDYGVAFVQHHLADILRTAGEIERAERLARAAVDWLGRHSVEVQDREYEHAVGVLQETLQAAGKTDEAIAVWSDYVADCRKKRPTDARMARSLGPLGLLLIENGEYARAEQVLRECVQLREELLLPGTRDHWLLFTARGLLGRAILEQADQQLDDEPDAGRARLDKAQALIEGSSEWLTANVQRVPAPWREKRSTEAIERMVRLYEVRNAFEPDQGYDDQAAEWRGRLNKLDSESSDAPASQPTGSGGDG